jgi:hypothetical protein
MSCDRGALPEALPADLTAVIDAWPDLPEALRAGIVAMVKAARSSLTVVSGPLPGGTE